MRRKSVIIGLVLLVVGSAAFVWVLTDKRKELRQAAHYKRKHALEMEGYAKEYNEWLQAEPATRPTLPWGLDKQGKAKLQARLEHEQRERLRADMDRLASEEKDLYPFADIIYGDNWRQEVDKYKNRKETRELAITASIVCMVAGGAIFAWWLLVAAVQWVIIVWFILKKFFAGFLESRSSAGGRGRTEAAEGESLLEEIDFDEQRELVPTSDGGAGSEGGGKEEQSGGRGGSRGSSGREKATSGGRRIGMLLKGDASLFDAGEPLKAVAGKPDKDSVGVGVLDKPNSPSLSDLREERSKLEDSLQAQSENLEKHMDEFKKVTETVQQKAFEHSEPLKDGLMELTEQVAAIREYASSQQERVEKLQNGYDWNIIRNFCVRVIRCIDGVEERIRRLSEEGVETGQLEEVRDELMFALESSGVERFEPEVNSDYRGQEKWAEAVKEREQSEKAKMSGKIAEVLRPGYRYVIDEENTKVVRTAQVKLFG